jgi:pimeloyl-ACP methyl ester carboxylesterase
MINSTHPSHQHIIDEVYEAFFTPTPSPLPAATDGLLAQAQNERIPFAETEIVVSTWGDGPTVLLVHGWGGNRLQLGAFVLPLVDAGYRVVAFDQPAHGDSPGKTTNVFVVADSLQVIGSYYGPFQAILAHSLGTLGTSFALVNRDFPHPSRLVYFGALNRLMDFVPRFQVMAQLSDEITAGLAQAIENRFGRDELEAITNARLVPHLPLPALLFHDRQDAVTPVSDSRAIARAWPGAQLVETDGLGHRRVLRDAKIIEQVVAFVRGED